MDLMIKAEPLADNAVYGVGQVQYAVAGKSGVNFVDAVTLASFRQATTIEETTGAYAKVVRARQQKIDELGEVLALIAKAVGKIDKKTSSSDKIEIDNAARVKEIAAKYEVKLSWDGDSMTRGNLQKAQTNVQYAIDREDNDIQQDIVTLQSYISKRDNAYSNASKVVRKSNQAATSTIGNIGD